LLAVRNQQLEIVQYLMNLSGDRKADPNEQNFKKQTAMSQLSSIKDEEVRRCMQGLLEKTQSSIKLEKNPG